MGQRQGRQNDAVYQRARGWLNTMAENKVAALAKVLRNNLGDDDKLDLAIVIVAALEDLGPPHVQVLNAMVNDEPIRLTSESFAEGAWPLSGLKVKFPAFAPGLPPIMAGLKRHGIVDGGGWAATAPEAARTQCGPRRSLANSVSTTWITRRPPSG